MKKYIAIIIFVIILISCKSDKEVKDNKNNLITIEGIVEKGMNNLICIVTNWESRSRISYYIDKKFYDEVSKDIGKIIKVEGYIIKEYDDNPWKKEFKIKSIINIK